MGGTGVRLLCRRLPESRIVEVCWMAVDGCILLVVWAVGGETGRDDDLSLRFGDGYGERSSGVRRIAAG